MPVDSVPLHPSSSSVLEMPAHRCSDPCWHHLTVRFAGELFERPRTQPRWPYQTAVLTRRTLLNKCACTHTGKVCMLGAL